MPMSAFEKRKPRADRPPPAIPGAEDRKAALPHLAIKNWALNGRTHSRLSATERRSVDPGRYVEQTHRPLGADKLDIP
jgi:hypothetical protein